MCFIFVLTTGKLRTRFIAEIELWLFLGAEGLLQLHLATEEPAAETAAEAAPEAEAPAEAAPEAEKSAEAEPEAKTVVADAVIDAADAANLKASSEETLGNHTPVETVPISNSFSAAPSATAPVSAAFAAPGTVDTNAPVAEPAAPVEAEAESEEDDEDEKPKKGKKIAIIIISIAAAFSRSS